MRYIGCKSNLLSHIEKIVADLGIQSGIFCDLFAGTASVSAHFKKRGFHIISNDLLELSYVFQHALIANNTEPGFTAIASTLGDVPSEGVVTSPSSHQKVIAWLNCLPGKKGFIFHTYCPSGDNPYKRQYLSDRNGQKLDAIRQQLQAWRENGCITQNEYYLLLLSILESTSKVANISGTYGAYLKHWDPRTYKDLKLVPIDIIQSNVPHQVFRRDANKVIEEIQCDILYLDPPYNTRQYITNYHMLETIARYDNPQTHGKTGLRNYGKHEKSAYCSKSNCLSAFEDLIEKADAKYILVSYSNEGILSKDEILSVLSRRGKPQLNTPIDYQRFKSSSSASTHTSQKRTEELLFFVEVLVPARTFKPKQKNTAAHSDPRNRLNNLSGSEWTFFLNSIELEGDGESVGTLNNLSENAWALASAPVWDTHYPTRGSESYAHKIRKEHPSPKPPQLMRRLIEFFTRTDGRVLDPFSGVGGTLLACSLTKRHGVGIELSQKYLNLYHHACADLDLATQRTFCGDARKLKTLLKNEPLFDLVLTDPPYIDMLSRKRTGEQKKKTASNSPTPFSNRTDDLGNMKTSQFYTSLTHVIEEAMSYLKSKGYIVIFCKDLQPTEKQHNMVHAEFVNTLSKIENLRFRGYKIWYDKSLRLYPFGYPYAYVSNQLHQFILIFRKET